VPPSHFVHNVEATSRFFRTPVQAAATAFAEAFLLLGVAGFIPGITSNVGQLGFSGYQSHAELFGIFHVSVMHNLLHLILGCAGIVLSRKAARARSYLVVGGGTYLVPVVCSTFATLAGSDDVVFDANDWLHLGIAAAMITVGVALGHRHDAALRHRVHRLEAPHPESPRHHTP
jgi:hypothetical protein